jgi:hypothetical protein
VLGREERAGLLVEVLFDERRDDEAGTDRVDPHALRGILERGVLGQADDRVLGGHVGRGAGEAGRAENRGDVDDRAPARRGDGRQLRAQAAIQSVAWLCLSVTALRGRIYRRPHRASRRRLQPSVELREVDGIFAMPAAPS